MYLSLQCWAHPQKCISIGKNQYPVPPAGRNAELFAQSACRIVHQKHFNVCHGSSETPTLQSYYSGQGVLIQTQMLTVKSCTAKYVTVCRSKLL